MVLRFVVGVIVSDDPLLYGDQPGGRLAFPSDEFDELRPHWAGGKAPTDACYRAWMNACSQLLGSAFKGSSHGPGVVSGPMELYEGLAEGLYSYQLARNGIQLENILRGSGVSEREARLTVTGGDVPGEYFVSLSDSGGEVLDVMPWSCIKERESLMESRLSRHLERLARILRLGPPPAWQERAPASLLH